MKKKSIKNYNRAGYLFVLPFVIVFLIFNVYPVLRTLYLSFTNAKIAGVGKIQWVWFDNYIRVITDKFFWRALGNTLRIWGVNIVLQLGLAFLLTIIFSDIKYKIKGLGIFRVIYYLPNLIAATSVAFLFKTLLDWRYGTFNQIIYQVFKFFGKSYNPIDWLGTAAHAGSTIAVISAWMWFGNSFIMLMAGVQGISKVGAKIAGIPVVASMENVYDVVCQMMVDEVFLSLPGVEPAEIREMVHRFEEMGLVCHYRVDLFSKANPNTYVQQLAGYSVISFSLQSQDSRRLLVKRLMDIIGSLIGCVLTLLITPFVALAIKIDSPGPVFFSQTRIGKNGRRFKIWKFRSMYTDAEARKKELEAQNEIKGLMFKMEDDPRITKVGKFIRIEL